MRASFTSVSEEVGRHQNNFREVVRILQTHEEHMVKTGATSQEMAQRINALIQENANKTVWISSLMRDSQEQTRVLRQHQLGLQVQAEVIKAVANQQQNQQQQGVTGTGPTVTDVDDHNDDRLDFSNVPSPNSGPPNNGGFGVAMKEVPQVPTSMDMVPRL